MRLSAPVAAFAARIGHDFRRPELLIEALTHPSFSAPSRPDNQRLEFLGDRVLGLVLAEALMARDSEAREGQLAPRFNALARRETCAEVAREVGLGDVLRLGRSEMLTGGRRKEALLADAMEAVIAAVHLDAGFDAARQMVLRVWGSRIAGAASVARDAKTTLQERVQGLGQSAPVYVELQRSGPDHAPQFTVEVRLEDGTSAHATAGAKRQAEQAAAAALLQRLEQDA